MAAGRKQQADIDKLLKKVEEGLEEFNTLWDNLRASTNQNQKEKYESELKSQIKKLQRERDQIKTYLADKAVKEKTALQEAKKRIEVEMERFKDLEREVKTKQFSKEGLAKSDKVDPQEEERRTHRQWIQEAIDSLTVELDELAAEIELKLGSGTKKKKERSADESAHINHLKNIQESHRWHLSKLELLMRKVINDMIELSEVESVRDNVEFYVQGNSREVGEFNEFDTIYEGLGLDVVEDLASLRDRDRGSDVDNDGASSIGHLESEPEAAKSSAPASPHVGPAPPPTMPKRAAAAAKKEKAQEEPAEAKSRPSSAPRVSVSVWQNPLPPPEKEKTVQKATSAPQAKAVLTRNKSPSSVPAASPPPDRPPVPGQAPVVAKATPAPPPAKPGPAPGPPPQAPPRPGQPPSQAPPPPTQAPPPPQMRVPPPTGQPRPAAGTMNMPAPPSMPPPAPDQAHRDAQAPANIREPPNMPPPPPPAAPPPPPPAVNATAPTIKTAPPAQTPPPPPQALPPQQPESRTDGAAGTGARAAAAKGGATPQPDGQAAELDRTMTPASSAGKGAASAAGTATAAVTAAAARNVPPPPAAQPPPPAPAAPAASPERSTTAQRPGAAGGTDRVDTPHRGRAEVRDGRNLQYEQPQRQTLQQQQQHPPQQLIHRQQQPQQQAAVPLQLPHLQQLHQLQQHQQHHRLAHDAHQRIAAAGMNLQADRSPSPRMEGGLSGPQSRALDRLAQSFGKLPTPGERIRNRTFTPQTPYTHQDMGRPIYPTVPLRNFEAPEAFEKYDLDLLFFVFYFQIGTYQQHLAAKELKKLAWRFHTKYHTWFQRHEEPKQTAPDFERGTYVYFDKESWCKRIKYDFAFEYQYLEDDTN
mmetsp:Transcript_89780/g.187599  ORF Transcript_89780/g.187599 Transcript_89780/m.187599 type:complete len:870 (-) Transcript_89780:609-3218(-)